MRLFCIVDGRSVFINEIIGRNLVAVGHAVNMSLFNSGTISGPASGRSSHGLDFPDSVSHPVVPLPISSATNMDSSERTSDLTLPGDARQSLTDMRISVQVGQPPLRRSSSDNFSHTGSSMSTGCGGVPDVCSWMSVRDMDAADGAREIIGVPTNPPAGNAAWTGQQTGILADIRGALHDSLLPVNDFRHSPTTLPGGEELSSNHEDIERCRSLPLMMGPAVDIDIGGPCFTHPSLSFHAGSPFLSTDPIDLEHLSRPLPLYVTLPSEGVWFGVHIISVSDPSSFVVSSTGSVLECCQQSLHVDVNSRFCSQSCVCLVDIVYDDVGFIRFIDRGMYSVEFMHNIALFHWFYSQWCLLTCVF